MKNRATTLLLNQNACKNFLAELSSRGLNFSCLDQFREDLVSLEFLRSAWGFFFGKVNNNVTEILGDPSAGFVALDVPSGLADTPEGDTMQGAVIAISAALSQLEPAIDPLNGTPFAIYSASKSNEKLLNEAGLQYYAPEHKLGFHSDGAVSAHRVYIPHIIAIYNIFIGYSRPGKFLWVPTQSWSELDKFAELIGWNALYSFALTPIIHRDHGSDKLKTETSEMVVAPIFWRDKRERERSIFLNGYVLGPAEDTSTCWKPDVIEEMRRSLETHSKVFFAENRQRRAFLMRNSAGFHAREMFQGAVENLLLTRSFFRMVDRAGFQIS